LGAKVAVLDFVKPTPIGTTWGIGGTCVNVGCIPKKLMHQSALLGEGLHDSREYGWQTPEGITHDWETMKNNIVNYIKSLNFGYKVQLRDRNVEYINAYGQFVDNHKLILTYKNGKTKEITANKIVIATGGRPKYPESIIGAKEYSITSDDLFSLPYNPGKTLCVGASYVSLECAGFLKGIGNDVTVMVRSILLRGFDQQMANIIGKYMEETANVRFIRESVPTEIIQLRAPNGSQAGEHLVKYKNGAGEIVEEKFNTVILAVGRDPCTSEICINRTNVKLNPKNQKIITNFEQTNVDNIYGIGDVIDETTAGGRVLELTPIAIKAGELLAKRLFGGSDLKMDYHSVPTTVFTPIEYGAIGYSEEEAIEKFGEDNIDVYHANFWPLEWTVAHRPNDVSYAKLICNISDNNRVIGLHVAGPNAGEITQGYAVAIKLRATKADFDMTIGIHPTCSEVISIFS
jgi:thioredoxin reductase (NADPH)